MGTKYSQILISYKNMWDDIHIERGKLNKPHTKYRKREATVQKVGQEGEGKVKNYEN
jgi:hypothetical protein